MNSKIVSNSKAKPFSKLKELFNTLLSTDIEDENSGLDSYINNSNIQSEEDRENARIAQELKDSLSSINSALLEQERNSKPRKNSSTMSLKTETNIISSTKSKGNIHTISTLDDKDRDF